MRELLQRLAPSQDERQEMAQKVATLVAAVQAETDGQVTVQGSIAKDTWLVGSQDVDLFVLFPNTVAESEFPKRIKQAAKALTHAQAKYAQHPYMVGKFEGLDVDLVPAYHLDDASQRMSAVDRTPFHTAWVNGNLSDAQKGDVMLAKAWAKGVRIYGAETSIGGFSGYLIEILIATLGDFDAFLQWLRQPTRVVPAEDACDMESVLVVPDPVDPARNTAAAVTAETLERAATAANAFLAAPAEYFFFPPTPTPKDVATLQSALATKNQGWSAIQWTPATDRLDLVYPQFQKACRIISQELQRQGFTIHQTLVKEQGTVLAQFLYDATPQPSERWHQGPPAGTPNAEKFAKKWSAHPDLLEGPVNEDGKLKVRVQHHLKTVALWLDAQYPKQPLGKHVQKARTLLLHDVNDAPEAWMQDVSDFITQRQPWQP